MKRLVILLLLSACLLAEAGSAEVTRANLGRKDFR